jgi:hypothetical protein
MSTTIGRSTSLALGFFASFTVTAGCSSDDEDVAEIALTDATISDATTSEAHEMRDADFGAPSDTYPAYTPPLPTALSRGAPVLKDFTVVPVLFAGDTGAANVPDFLTRYAASAEWGKSVAEYGVGKITVGATVTLTEPAPKAINDPEVRSWLFAKLDGTHPEWGATDEATLEQTLFLLVYPSGTRLSDAPGRFSCADFFGYHSGVRLVPPPLDGGAPDATIDASPGGDVLDSGDNASMDSDVPDAAGDLSMDGDTSDGAASIEGGAEGGAGSSIDGGVLRGPLIYSPIARCTATGSTQEETLTAIISHELIEAATNPFGRGYLNVDNDHLPWQIGMHGGEIADLCNVLGSYWKPLSIGYAIARAWSNSAASMHHDPCVPGPPGEVYFNSFIVPTDDLSFSNAPPNAPTIPGVRVLAGETRTVDVLLFSDQPTPGPWEVMVQEVPLSRSNPKALTLALDRAGGVNGEKVHLTITARQSVSGGITMVALFSKIGKRELVWFTMIGLS